MGSSWGRGRGKERREVARDSGTASRQRNCRRRETWEGLKAPRHPRVGGRTMKKDVHRVVYGVNVAYEGRRRQSGASSRVRPGAGSSPPAPPRRDGEGSRRAPCLQRRGGECGPIALSGRYGQTEAALMKSLAWVSTPFLTWRN